MTVFVAHAPANRQDAEGLERYLERRGQFVELDDGQTALRPVEASDVVALLVSAELSTAPTRLRLEQRALDAWAEGRLILIKLDDGRAPLGLRDMAAIEMSLDPGAEPDWQLAGDAILDAAAAPHVAKVANMRKRDGLGALLTVLLMLPGLGALAVLGAIWLVNRIGPTPGGLPELRAGVDQFGHRYGMPAGLTEWVIALAIVALLAAIGMLASALLSRSSAGTGRPPVKIDQRAVFVSCAQANQADVAPVLEAAQRGGRKFRLDLHRGAPAGALAGEIIRTIRSAAGVVVMCSKAAFESDRVKREIYLADRYGKKLVPVFIEQAETPDDFEYFFAGARRLNLFETPEAERPQALLRVLGATA